ncbi:hypothetical protein BHE89_16975 [Shigella sp. FC1967]|uniref:hypothetical protein n=1 Tax=Shigella sp. FC1967 TaxID=1898041 RepID=UPI00086BDB44|nr:hypothetical protein [Shigella sp. FC1967]OEJ07443.1 hypothetical protein BHE89_16975 [Shigella sp. FC1967]
MTAKEYDLRYTQKMEKLFDELMNFNDSYIDEFTERAIIPSYLGILGYHLSLPSLSVASAIWTYLDSNMIFKTYLFMILEIW